MKWKGIVFMAVCFISCQDRAGDTHTQYEWHGLEVTASAYNSVPWQTKAVNPSIAAWGDTLQPGMKSIAVSRDLLKLGLTHNTMVKIEDWPDTFLVKDKMNKKWRNRIDIYMGLDVKKAREWGKQKISICYAVRLDSITTPTE